MITDLRIIVADVINELQRQFGTNCRLIAVRPYNFNRAGDEHLWAVFVRRELSTGPEWVTWLWNQEVRALAYGDYCQTPERGYEAFQAKGAK